MTGILFKVSSHYYNNDNNNNDMITWEKEYIGGSLGAIPKQFGN